MSDLKNDNKEARMVLLIVMFFVILAVVIIALVLVERNWSLMKGNGQDELSSVSANKTKKTSEEEKKEIEQGLVKMVAGKATSIEEGQGLVVDTNPFGQNREEVKIVVTPDTKFLAVREGEQKVSKEDDLAGTSGEEEAVMKMNQSQTEDEKLNVSAELLKEGQMIEVYFAKRIDIENASMLMASEVVILPDKQE